MNTPLPLDAAKTLKVTACICVYCGESVAYGPSLTDDAIQAVRDSMMAHDAVCPKNPIAARVAELEAENVAATMAYADARVLAGQNAAHANALRDALEGAVEWMAEEGCDCGQGDPLCALCEAIAALAAHPAASLAAHDAEVLERARVALNDADADCECGNISAITTDNVIRALAAHPAASLAAHDAEVWRKAAHIAHNWCLVPPDGGAPTTDEVNICEGLWKHFSALAAQEVKRTEESPTLAPKSAVAVCLHDPDYELEAGQWVENGVVWRRPEVKP